MKYIWPCLWVLFKYFHSSFFSHCDKINSKTTQLYNSGSLNSYLNLCDIHEVQKCCGFFHIPTFIFMKCPFQRKLSCVFNTLLILLNCHQVHLHEVCGHYIVNWNTWVCWRFILCLECLSHGPFPSPFIYKCPLTWMCVSVVFLVLLSHNYLVLTDTWKESISVGTLYTQCF